MSAVPTALLIVLGILAATVLGVFVVMFLIIPLFKALGWLFRQIGRFIGGEVVDIARALGALLAALVFIPMAFFTFIIGRWSSAAHYGRALTSELRTFSLCLYRIVIGHPVRLFGMGGLLEGIENRLPAAVAEAPGTEASSGSRASQYAGYRIVGTLPVGGSGAKLYVAEPDKLKQAAFIKAGLPAASQVVIKSFSLADGSSLPQIVRESRALDAAKRMGLILDHDLGPDRFFYVMRYVPGESLTASIKRLHAPSAPSGLADRELRLALSYVRDVVATLSAYHKGGLWHKDVKPDNVIVERTDSGMRATLVDFGLLTSLRSAMTLTTHGTEYFRDPELVRRALKGVKVHEVDGTRFDVYGAGAVLYSAIEDSFPDRGVLSHISRRCPESVKWVIRRAMADYDKRYASADEMLADLNTILLSSDPFALRPADLPSVRSDARMLDSGEEPAPQPRDFVAAPAPDPSPAPQAAPAVAAAIAAGSPAPRSAPAIRVLNWWTGRSTTASAAPIPVVVPEPVLHRNAAPVIHEAAAAPQARRPAQEQLASARARVEAARDRAHQRFSRIRPEPRRYSNGINGGVVLAIAITSAALLGGAALVGSLFHTRTVIVQSHDGPGMLPAPQQPEMPAPPLAPEFSLASDTKFPSNLEPPTKVLIICDAMQPWSEETNNFVKSLASILEQTEAVVMGNHPGERAPEINTDEETQLLADARLAIGRTPPESPAAAQAASDWLNRNRDIGAMIWIAPPLTPGGENRVSIFTPTQPASAEYYKAVRALIEAIVSSAGKVEPASRSVTSNPYISR